MGTTVFRRIALRADRLFWRLRWKWLRRAIKHYWLSGESPPAHGLGFVLAHKNGCNAEPVGSGFIVVAKDHRAIFITAAHVLTYVRDLQAGPRRHHASALPEFLPPPRAIDLDRRSLRVVSINNERVEVAVVEGLAFEINLDFALLQIAVQDLDRRGDPHFDKEFLADDYAPSVGDEVVVWGFSGMNATSEEVANSLDKRIDLRMVRTLRKGRVIARYPNGHRLCKGPCVETTIPVFPGMSGSPVFHAGSDGEPMRAFGLVCCDPFEIEQDRYDTTQPGSSIVALLPCEVETQADGKRMVRFSLPIGHVAGQFQIE